MKKPFLLIAGHNYYPGAGTSDWIGCYQNYEQAKGRVYHEPIPLEVFERGPRKGQVKPDQIQLYKYKIVDCHYDWFEIIDLRTWTDD